jgi:hypothetical protein
MTNILRKVDTEVGTVILVLNGGSWWVEITSDFMFGNTYHDCVEKASKEFDAQVKKMQLIEIINQHTTEMEGYSYFGSNPGVPVDVYEEVAESIMKKWQLK